MPFLLYRAWVAPWRLTRGLALAQTLGADFWFAWEEKDSDGVFAPQETFSQKFLEDHHVEMSEYDSRPILDAGSPLNFFDVMRVRMLSHSGVIVRPSRKNSNNGVVRTGVTWRDPTLSSAMEQITFAEDIEEVRAFARALGGFDLAIHVRRGDLKVGLARIGAWYVDKLIPLPLVIEIIKVTPRTSRVLLVDNDKVVAQSFLDRFPNVLRSSEVTLPAEDLPRLRTFLDFFLLSSSKEVVTGSSHFAVCASEIGGSKQVSWRDLLTQQQAKELISHFLKVPDGNDKIEMALACDFALCVLREPMSHQEQVSFVEAGFLADPSNPIYSLKMASELLRNRDFNAARELLVTATNLGGLASLYECAAMWRSGHADHAFRHLVRRGGILLPEDWGELEKHRGRVPVLDWWLLAGDSILHPEKVEGLFADVVSAHSLALPSDLDVSFYRNLFQTALNAQPY